jgi:hypothetical protein
MHDYELCGYADPQNIASDTDTDDDGDDDEEPVVSEECLETFGLDHIQVIYYFFFFLHKINKK